MPQPTSSTSSPAAIDAAAARRSMSRCCGLERRGVGVPDAVMDVRPPEQPVKRRRQVVMEADLALRHVAQAIIGCSRNVSSRDPLLLVSEVSAGPGCGDSVGRAKRKKVDFARPLTEFTGRIALISDEVLVGVWVPAVAAVGNPLLPPTNIDPGVKGGKAPFPHALHVNPSSHVNAFLPASPSTS